MRFESSWARWVSCPLDGTNSVWIKTQNFRVSWSFFRYSFDSIKFMMMDACNSSKVMLDW